MGFFSSPLWGSRNGRSKAEAQEVAGDYRDKEIWARPVAGDLLSPWDESLGDPDNELSGPR